MIIENAKVFELGVPGSEAHLYEGKCNLVGTTIGRSC